MVLHTSNASDDAPRIANAGSSEQGANMGHWALGKANNKLAATSWYKRFLNLWSAQWAMLDNEKLQLVGPVSVVTAVASADFGARALAHWPTSTLLGISIWRSFGLFSIASLEEENRLSVILD